MALCLSGQCVETLEQIAKMVATFRFRLKSNLHGTVRLTADTSSTGEGDELLSSR